MVSSRVLVCRTRTDRTLRMLGYQPTRADPCILVKFVDGYSVPIILSIYVDHTIILYHPSLEYVWLSDKSSLMQEYVITDMGDCQLVLNMQVHRTAGGITLSQEGYIDRLLQQYDLSTARDTITPALLNDLTVMDESDTQLTINQHMLYRQLVGSVLYVSNVTRPDITHTVNMLARFVSCPTLKHLTAGIHLLRYLKHTKKMKLRIPMQ